MSTTSAKQQADAGKLRIIFHFDDPKPFGLNPSIPSMASFYPNIPDIEVGVYYYTSSKVPMDIINALEGAMEKMSKDPEYLKGIAQLNQVAKFVSGKIIMEDRIPQKMKLVGDIMKSTASGK